MAEPEVNPQFLKACAQYKLDLWRVLEMSPDDVAKCIHWRVKDVVPNLTAYKHNLQIKTGSPHIFESRDDNRVLCTTRDINIDSLLRGGIHPGEITEVWGYSGAGKTCFCLQVALHTLANNPLKRVLFISTEGKLWHKRMVQMLECMEQEGYGDAQHIMGCLDKVEYALESKLYTLIEMLDHYREKGYALVIVDSISSFKSTSRLWLATKLYEFAMKTKASVLVTNQARTYLAHDVERELYSEQLEQQQHQFYTGTVPAGETMMGPALGFLWTSVISTRILLERRGGTLRRFTLVFSKCGSSGSLDLELDERGLHSN